MRKCVSLEYSAVIEVEVLEGQIQVEVDITRSANCPKQALFHQPLN